MGWSFGAKIYKRVGTLALFYSISDQIRGLGRFGYLVGNRKQFQSQYRWIYVILRTK